MFGVALGASASKIPDSFRTLRHAARSFVNLSCTAFAVGFSLNESAIGWYSTPEMSRPNPNRSSERSFSTVHFIFLDFGRPASGPKKPPSTRWSIMGVAAGELVPMNVSARSLVVASDWKVHILDSVATDALRRASGILLVPASTVSLAAVGVPRGCGQMKGDDLCVLPTGIGLGDGTAFFVGWGVGLERWPSMIAKVRSIIGLGDGMADCVGRGDELECRLSTIARARSIVGLTGASCSLPLPRTGIGLGDCMAACAGRGDELERWLSTIARARSIVGLTGAFCSLPLPWLLLRSDILVLSEVLLEE
jgi:hypothetical protein